MSPIGNPLGGGAIDGEGEGAADVVGVTVGIGVLVGDAAVGAGEGVVAEPDGDAEGGVTSKWVSAEELK